MSYKRALEAAKTAMRAAGLITWGPITDQHIQAGISTYLSTIVPDEGCTCHGCGLKYRADLMVPDDVWERIKPAGASKGAGLLCARCIMERIVEAGIWSAGRVADVDVDREDVGNSKKITYAELEAWFSNEIPPVAVKIMFPERSLPLTTAELRHVLAALAAVELGRRAMPADHLTTEDKP